MRRFLIPALAAVLLLLLAPATEAQAMRVDGSGLEPTGAQAAQAATIVELGNYIAAASTAYRELDACTCCCARLDLPNHDCPACTTSAAAIRQIVARVRHVQAALARLDVPAPAQPVHRDLLAASRVMHVSGDYMAREVLSDPRSLVMLSTQGRGLKGRLARWVPSPDIVPDARLAAFLETHHSPMSRTARMHALEIATTAEPGFSGGPGEQAQAYLAEWRAGVEALARQTGVTLPEALFS
jgi:hypothetical protein